MRTSMAADLTDMKALLATAALLTVTLGGQVDARPLPKAPECPIFPASFATNQRVDTAPVLPNSDALIASIGAERTLHPDFGSGTWEGFPIGIPFTVVSRTTPRSPVDFEYAGESDRVRYPIPSKVRIEGDPGGDGDRHALLVDKHSCRLYELFALRREGARWAAGAGAVWNLRKPRMRPAGWTSADAAGLPILPLLARYDEVAAGAVKHALRFTVRRSRRAYVFPARHFASSLTGEDLPRMGERFRLKRSVDISGFPRQARVLARAMKRYGLIVADNGSDWFISGAPDPRWDNDQLRALKQLRGADFEAVDARY